MKKTEKRGNAYIINLTDKEAEKLALLSDKAKRTKSNFLYLIVAEILEQLNPEQVGAGVVIEDLR